jgi:methionine-rich copper-binding protein CopC
MKPIRKAIVTVAALAAFAIAGQAAAHARLLSGTPKNGATVAAPKLMILHYSEELVPTASSVNVTGPTAAAVATGPMALDKTKKVVTVPFAAALGAGHYTVAWHMKTEDGHETDGTFAFTVK